MLLRSDMISDHIETREKHLCSKHGFAFTWFGSFSFEFLGVFNTKFESPTNSFAGQIDTFVEQKQGYVVSVEDEGKLQPNSFVDD